MNEVKKLYDDDGCIINQFSYADKWYHKFSIIY